MPRGRGILACLLTGFILVGCSSSKVSLDEPTPMDKTLNAGTGSRQDKVGVRGNEIVVQKKVYLEEELTKIKDEITDMENDIYGQSVRDPGGMYVALKDCRKRLSDPRVGGGGTPEPMEVWEKPSETDTDFDYRVDKKNNVVAVDEQELGAKISNLKKTRNILQRRYSDFKTKVENCEIKYRTALVNNGLNPDDTQASGEWVEEGGTRVWKMRKPSTKDPEELMRRKQERQKSTSN